MQERECLLSVADPEKLNLHAGVVHGPLEEVGGSIVIFYIEKNASLRRIEILGLVIDSAHCSTT